MIRPRTHKETDILYTKIKKNEVKIHLLKSANTFLLTLIITYYTFGFSEFVNIFLFSAYNVFELF